MQKGPVLILSVFYISVFENSQIGGREIRSKNMFKNKVPTLKGWKNDKPDKCAFLYFFWTNFLGHI